MPLALRVQSLLTSSPTVRDSSISRQCFRLVGGVGLLASSLPCFLSCLVSVFRVTGCRMLNGLIVAGLLAVPILAVERRGVDLWWVAAYALVVGAITYGLYAV